MAQLTRNSPLVELLGGGAKPLPAPEPAAIPETNEAKRRRALLALLGRREALGAPFPGIGGLL